MTQRHDHARYLRLARKAARRGEPLAAARWSRLAAQHKEAAEPRGAPAVEDEPDNAEAAELRARLDELIARLRGELAEAEAEAAEEPP
jgi:hypothetical protein